MSASNIGPNGWQTSNRFCANAGLVLPDAGEAMTIARNVVAVTQIWTSDLVGDGTSGVVITAATVDPVQTVEPIANNNFARCIAPLTD